MNRKLIIALIVGVLVGAGSVLSVSALVSKDNKATIEHLHEVPDDLGTLSMADMNAQLEALSGDEFDKIFLEMMITHHEGAVDMANYASTRAKHDEIKQLSKEIIVAQEKEIADMKHWQKNWGYPTDEAVHNAH